MLLFFAACLRLALGLCPPGFRREYGNAIQADFAHAFVSENALHGTFGAVMYGLAATIDVLNTALREYLAMFFRDFSYALRALRKTPSFSAIVVFTLAIAIGANAAVFSVLHTVVLAPLPFAQPERLVALDATLNAKPFDFSLPEIADIVRGTPDTFANFAAFSTASATLTGRGEPRKIEGVQTTPGLFETLGIQPLVGRFMEPSDAVRGATKTIVLSERLYRQAFDSDPQTIGSLVKLNDESYRVIGVVPATFKQPRPQYGFGVPDYWTVVPVDGAGTQYHQRGYHSFDAIARLAPAVSLATARSGVAAIVATMQRRYPADDATVGVGVTSLTDSLVGNVRALFFTLFAAVGAVLLVACANVANLLLSRSASREREFSVRIAIGASRGRIVAQLLIETFVLAIAGGAIGIALAYGAVATFVASHPPNIPRAELVSVDGSAIVYTFGVVAFCTLAAGLAPAFTSAQRDVALALKSAGRGGDAHRGARARSVLVVSEIAMTLALVIAAGLVVRSFVTLTTQPLGFDPKDVRIVGIVDLPDRRYTTDAARGAFLDRALHRIQTLPGVTQAAWGYSFPFSSGRMGTSFSIVGRAVSRGHEPDATMSPVGADYFAAMHATLRAGRAFTSDDTFGGAQVVMINETLARSFFPGRSPIGAYIVPSMSLGAGAPPRRRIVGVVADLRTSFAKSTEATIYAPTRQLPFNTLFLIVRSLPGVDCGPAVANALVSLDPLLPKPEVVTMSSLLAANVAVQRLTVAALCTLAFVALSLSIAGVFAVVSYGVTQRTHEFGVRMALGAQAGQIVQMVVAGAMRLALAGIVLGLLVAGAGTRLFADQLFETQPLDPLTFGSVTALVILAALAAALVPARRATRVDPIVALRYE